MSINPTASRPLVPEQRTATSTRQRSPRSQAIKIRLFNWACNYPQREWILPLFRRLLPILPVKPGFAILRDEDVREVLQHNKEFPVPWADKMRLLTQGRNFVLGMEEDCRYRLSYQQLTQAFKREDVPKHVTPLAARASEEILRQGSPLDAVEQLVVKVPAELCESYFGIAIPDKLRFAHDSITVSQFAFAPPWPKSQATKETQDIAMQAAADLHALFDASIDATLNGEEIGIVLPRLIRMHRHNPSALPITGIKAHLLGMVLGFIPTNVLAGGNMLDTLLRRKDFMAHAREAAFSDDDALLWRHLQETLRFRHINLGAFRTTWEHGYTLAAGTPREKFIPGGTPILASTQSAMFDSRRVRKPNRYDANRSEDEYLVFGYGQHWCLGAYIAIAQLTQTFKALLHRPGLRRVRGKEGRMQRRSTFPAHLHVEWDS